MILYLTSAQLENLRWLVLDALNATRSEIDGLQTQANVHARFGLSNPVSELVAREEAKLQVIEELHRALRKPEAAVPATPAAGMEDGKYATLFGELKKSIPEDIPLDGFAEKG